MKQTINSKSKSFLFFCFSFLLGVFVASILQLQSGLIYLYLSLFISLSLIIYFWSNQTRRFIFLCLFFLIIGFARYVFAFPSVLPQEGEQTFIGVVVSEPDVRIDSVNYSIESCYLGHGSCMDVLVKSGLYPRFEYGDELSITCKLKKPDGMYYAKEGTFLSCDRPDITKIGEKKGSFLMAKILALKHIVAERVNRLWHEPQASFMAGLLYGYRGGLGDLNDLFNRTGVTHIVAISGYNISIIAIVLCTICVQLYIPRKKAFWLVSTGIVLFVIFTGAGASVVRAGIMGLIVLLAKQIGRMSQAGRVLVFTAVLMCLHNPLVLVWDAGFQLSFVATFGLVYLSPIVGDWIAASAPPRRFLAMTDDQPSLRGGAERSLVPTRDRLRNLSRLKSGIFETFVATISAIIATLPLILYQFGHLSIVAPIVNILILWTIPYIMLAGFLAVIGSFVFYPLGKLISWLALFGLNYIIEIVRWFGSLPFAAIDLTIPVWLMFGLYGGIIYVVCRQFPSPGRRG